MIVVLDPGRPRTALRNATSERTITSTLPTCHTYKINPRVYESFAAKAEMEKARRKAERALILEKV